MSTHFLLVYKADYADEFNIYGLRIMESEEWNTKRKELDQLFQEMNTGETEPYSRYSGKGCVEHHFGTNESVEYSSAEEVLGNITAIPISSRIAKILTLLLTKRFGHLPTFNTEDGYWEL